jgi:putative holliday junction resolvase
MSRILSLDFGTKRIGIALSDSTLTLASPLPFLDATKFNALIEQLKTLIREKEIALILVGIPRNMDGSYGPSAEKARDFSLRLKEKLLIPIQNVDERLSTVEAQRRLQEAGKNQKKQRTSIDSSSAVIILQSYLDSPTRLR